jgi:hypothetical protein
MKCEVKRIWPITLLMVFFLVSQDLFSQQLGYFRDYMPMQIGPRAQGLGGAYTALVDDANAVTWNPGALGLLRSTSVVSAFSLSTITGEVSSSLTGSISARTSRNSDGPHFGLNNVAIAIPIELADQNVRIVPAFSYHQVSNYRFFKESWNIYYSSGSDFVDYTIGFDHSGGRNAYGFGLGLSISDYLGLGVVYNRYTGERVENVEQSLNSNIGFSDQNNYTTTTQFSGSSWAFGLKVSSTPFDDLKVMPGERYAEGVDFGLSLTLPYQSSNFVFDGNNISDSATYLFNDPLMIRSGVAFRFPEVMMSVDFSYADLSNRRIMHLNGFNSGMNPGDGISLYTLSMGFEFENMYRIGMLVRNYQFNTNENSQRETFSLTGGLSFGDDDSFIFDISAMMEFFNWDELDWGLYDDTFGISGVNIHFMAGLRIFLD